MKIRPYRSSDARDFLRLVRELARYEELEPPTPAAGRRLVRDIGRRIHVLMAELDGRKVGYALYHFTYSSFLARPMLYLEDVFVLSEHRGRGLGKAFFRALFRAARSARCVRMEWAVLNWNEPAIRFYDGLGARPLKDWTTYRLETLPGGPRPLEGARSGARARRGRSPGRDRSRGRRPASSSATGRN